MPGSCAYPAAYPPSLGVVGGPISPPISPPRSPARSPAGAPAVPSGERLSGERLSGERLSGERGGANLDGVAAGISRDMRLAEGGDGASKTVDAQRALKSAETSSLSSSASSGVPNMEGIPNMEGASAGLEDSTSNGGTSATDATMSAAATGLEKLVLH